MTRKERMPIFEYEAVDGAGQALKGTVMGADLQSVGVVLQQRGLQVHKLQTALSADPLNAVPPAPQPKADPAAVPFGRQVIHAGDGIVPLTQMAVFTRQLAILLNAGINPHECFANLQKQTQHPVLIRFCDEARDETQKGGFLSPIFDRYSNTFSPLYRALLKAGERGGFVVQALTEIAGYLEAEIALRNKYRMATIYPKLLAAAGFVIILLANWIGSEVAGRKIFNSPLHEPRVWFILGPVLIGMFLFFRYGGRNAEIRAGYERFLASLPWFGATTRQFAMAKFGRAFGALYRSGMTPSESLDLASQATGNLAIERAIQPAVESLRQGKGITESLSVTNVFDSTVLQMMSTGERTGEIDQMMGKLAEYYEQEASVRAKQTATATGVLVLMGVMIYFGFMILSAAGPIVNAYPEAMREAENAGGP